MEKLQIFNLERKNRKVDMEAQGQICGRGQINEGLAEKT